MTGNSNSNRKSLQARGISMRWLSACGKGCPEPRFSLAASWRSYGTPVLARSASDATKKNRSEKRASLEKNRSAWTARFFRPSGHLVRSANSPSWSVTVACGFLAVPPN